MLQSLIDKSQINVNGIVKLKIYKGNVIVLGRKSNSAFIRQKWLLLREMIFTIKKMQRVLSNLMP